MCLGIRLLIQRVRVRYLDLNRILYGWARGRSFPLTIALRRFLISILQKFASLSPPYQKLYCMRRSRQKVSSPSILLRQALHTIHALPISSKVKYPRIRERLGSSAWLMKIMMRVGKEAGSSGDFRLRLRHRYVTLPKRSEWTDHHLARYADALLITDQFRLESKTCDLCPAGSLSPQWPRLGHSFSTFSLALIIMERIKQIASHLTGSGGVSALQYQTPDDVVITMAIRSLQTYWTS